MALLGLWMPLGSDNLGVACEDLSQPEPEPLHSSFQKDGPSFIMLSFSWFEHFMFDDVGNAAKLAKPEADDG